MSRTLRYLIGGLLYLAVALILYSIHWAWCLLFVIGTLAIVGYISSTPAPSRNWAAIISRIVTICVVVALAIWIIQGIVNLFSGVSGTSPNSGNRTHWATSNPVEDKYSRVLFSGSIEPGQIIDLGDIQASPNSRLHYKFYAASPIAMRIRDHDPRLEAEWDYKNPLNSGDTLYMYKSGRLELRGLRERTEVKILALP